MLLYISIIVAALILALAATPVARRLAVPVGVINKPDPRKFQSRAIPRLGGVAIYLAFMIALIVFRNSFPIAQVVSIFVGAALVSVLGLWDDRFGVSPWFKLAGQTIGALILALSGVRIELLGNYWLNLGLTVLWVLYITNATNLGPPTFVCGHVFCISI